VTPADDSTLSDRITRYRFPDDDDDDVHKHAPGRRAADPPPLGRNRLRPNDYRRRTPHANDSIIRARVRYYYHRVRPSIINVSAGGRPGRRVSSMTLRRRRRTHRVCHVAGGG